MASLASMQTRAVVARRAAARGVPAACSLWPAQRIRGTCRRRGTCVRQHALPPPQQQQRDFAGSNLGALQRIIEQDPSPAADPYTVQRVSPDSFSSRGLYTDGPAIFGSAVLLVLLLALALERILGLDRFVVQAIRNWRDARQYERRNEIIKARQALEERERRPGGDGDGDANESA